MFDEIAGDGLGGGGTTLVPKVRVHVCWGSRLGTPACDGLSPGEILTKYYQLQVADRGEGACVF